MAFSDLVSWNCCSTEAHQGLLVVPKISSWLLSTVLLLFQLLTLFCIAFIIFFHIFIYSNNFFKQILDLNKSQWGLRPNQQPSSCSSLPTPKRTFVFFPINPLQVLVQHLLDYLQFHHCTHLSGSSCHSQRPWIFLFREQGNNAFGYNIFNCFHPSMFDLFKCIFFYGNQ